MSVTKFAFLPSNSAGATVHIFFFDCMLNTSPTCYLPLKYPSPCSYTSERRPWGPKLPDSITGSLMPVYDCLWNNARGRDQDPITFVPPHHLMTASPCLVEVARLFLHGGGTQFWRHEPTMFPCLPAENKSHLSISSKLCLRTFYLTLVGREGQAFGWQHTHLLSPFLPIRVQPYIDILCNL